MTNPLHELQRRLKGMREEEVPKMTLSILLAIRDRSREKTPIDTGTLINSAFTNMVSLPNFVEGTVGYTAEYAAAVAAMKGKLKGQPRGHFGKTRDGVSFGGGTQKGYYWDPQGQAEPDFFNKGIEEALEEDVPAIIRSMKQ